MIHYINSIDTFHKTTSSTIYYILQNVLIKSFYIIYDSSKFLAQNYTWLSLSSYLIEFVLLYLASSELEDPRPLTSSELEDDLPSSLVTRGVSTDTPSLSLTPLVRNFDRKLWKMKRFEQKIAKIDQFSLKNIFSIFAQN